jgi:hypothetical protein
MSKDSSSEDAATSVAAWRVPSNWAAFTATGAVALYFSGYLSYRSHLSAIGVAVDLNVLDQKYLLAGARFLLYTAYCVPIAVFLLLVVAPLIYPFWRMAVWISRWSGKLLERIWPRIWARILGFAQAPGANGIYLAALVWSVLIIQFIMVECTNYSNILVTRAAPGRKLDFLLLDRSGSYQVIFYVAVLASIIPGLLLVRTGQRRGSASVWQPLKMLTFFIIGVQFLLLPVNYGYFIDSRDTPSVILTGEKYFVGPETRTWLIDEGPTFLTTFRVTPRPVTPEAGKKDDKKVKKVNGSITAIRRDKIESIEVLCYADIFDVSINGAGCAP